MDWGYICELRPPTGLLFIKQVIISLENHDGKVWAGETDSSTWAPWQSYQQAKQEELSEGNDDLALRSIFVHAAKGSLTCRKILHGANGFTYPPKEGVLWIFIAVKSVSSSAGMNSRTFGPMVSTLAITPPRATIEILILERVLV
jgi:hypothetical protein